MRHLNRLPIWRDANRLLPAIEQAVPQVLRYREELGRWIGYEGRDTAVNSDEKELTTKDMRNTKALDPRSGALEMSHFCTLENQGLSPKDRWRDALRTGG